MSDDIFLTDAQEKCLVSMFNHIVNYHTIKDQLEDRDAIRAKNRYYLMTGYAGSGKSVVIKALIHMLNSEGYRGAVTAFTGRACQNLINGGIDAATSHSLFYKPVVDSKGNLLYFEKRSYDELMEVIGSYVLVEEASMMPSEILGSFINMNVPVLFVGDDAQLPAIKDKNIFDLAGGKKFKHMQLSCLDEILRTKDGSAIPMFADYVRRRGEFNFDIGGDDVIEITKRPNVKWFRANPEWDVVICGMNKTRKRLNSTIRAAKGYSDEVPEIGEKILCKKNSVVSNIKINNGSLYKVIGRTVGSHVSDFVIRQIGVHDEDLIGPQITVTVDNEYWIAEYSSSSNNLLQHFVFGYAMTCHASQGSTFRNVLFYDEDVSFFLDQKAFRYTAVTRASDKVAIVT